MKIIISGIILLIAIFISILERKRMNRYWQRYCTGNKWKNDFPNVSKKEIRNFLEEFVNAFAFNSKKRLKFSPDDKVMEIYQTLYPATGCADSLELETFVDNIQKKYGIDLFKKIDEKITLGNIFKMTR